MSNYSKTHWPCISGYDVSELIYEGSRTAVYRAKRTADQELVVVKVLQNRYPSASELVKFRNQYTLTQQLPVLGIVKPLALEAWQNSYALIMQDWGGVSLQQYLSQQQLSMTEILAIGLQLAEILRQLSQHRVVHKDVKPANILIHPDSKQVKLIDFSIATLLPKETQAMGHPNGLEGTLAYLAPEQTGRMNRGIDYRTDFYGLGVTLYELLTGELPFSENDPMALIHCHMAQMPVPPHRVNSKIPSVVSAIVLKLMAKNAEDRYQSAVGLKHDLNQCLTAWKDHRTMPGFELATGDRSPYFVIPEKLYGREAEVSTLLDAFNRVAEGKTEMLLVAGYSGIGKTAVVNEVHKPITRKRGYFLKGKFDQFNRNIPFSAFVQALRSLVQQWLAESDTQLQSWKTQLLATLGENSQVLIDVLPELEQLLGPQPPVMELTGTASQNRFNLLFQKFVGVVATAEHPLVLFLDDLQWADSASLRLMQLLMESSNYLLLIGAYRDNEVSPMHPLTLTLNELQQTSASLDTLTLEPLSTVSVNKLVADTLACSPVAAKTLTEVVYSKTQGNAFFTTQFLRVLHQNGWITFETTRGCWQADISQIRQAALTDDVVAFLADQLVKLPDDTQYLLKLAACIGNRFNLETLALVSEQSPKKAGEGLWTALQQGIILPQSDIYKFYWGETAARDVETGIQSKQQKNLQNVQYAFLHDRVQQAAYSLIPDSEKQRTHLTIGQLLLSNASALGERIVQEQLFIVVNHLNQGADLITDAAEQAQLVQLNLSAGLKAKAATAYAGASNYFQTALVLLTEATWEGNYALMLTLHQEWAEVEYLCGDYSESKRVGTIIRENAQSVVDQSKVCELSIQIAMAQNQFPEAIETGLTFLDQLGIDLLTPSSELALKFELPALDSLDQIPKLSDPKYLAAMRILVALIPSTFTAQPSSWVKIVLTIMEISLRYGHCDESTYGYIQYAKLLAVIQNQIDAGFESASLGLQLLAQQPENLLLCKAEFVYNFFIRHLKEPAANGAIALQQAMLTGMEIGDFEYVSYCACYASTVELFRGESLDVLSTRSEQHLVLSQQLKQYFAADALKAFLQVALNLQGKGNQPAGLLSGDFFQEETALPHLEAIESHILLHLVYACKAMLSFIMGQTAEALTFAELSDRHSGGVSAALASIGQIFYYSLSLLAENPASPDEQQCTLEKVEANQEKMAHWAAHAPSNFQHKHDLVEAERYRVLGERTNAIEAYERAISAAIEHNYPAEAALANELAAQFYLSWGKPKVAAGYLQEAYYGYAQWGARAKTTLLEEKYPDLLAPILNTPAPALNVLETLATVNRPHSLPSSPRIENSQSISTVLDFAATSTALDFAAILQAGHALSSTMQLDELLSQLTQIILKNSGADRFALMLPSQDNVWQVQAMATPAGMTTEPVDLEDCSELPLKLIRYVKNVQETVVIDNLETDLPVIGNYLRQQQPKSVLGLAILYQSQLRGIVVLENSNTSGVFSTEHITVLSFLCTQAVISLENARLYQQAQAYARELEDTQLQIVQNEKMASLGNLVAGVAHEINNPIGFLNGSIGNAEDYVTELSEHLSLYQTQYSDPTDSISTHAEEVDIEFIREDLPKLLASMRNATDRIKGISTSLRTFSRADVEHKVTASLQEGLDSTLLILKYRLKANDQRPEIQVQKIYNDPLQINCFPGQLNQVFMNILANAIDMFDEVAQKTTYSALEKQPQIITVQTSLTDDSTAEIRIRDNGQGMPETVKSKIFEHLFTTKAVGKGTGLGLAISRKIVRDNHGGKLEVHSQVGKGTEFRLDLPTK